MSLKEIASELVSPELNNLDLTNVLRVLLKSEPKQLDLSLASLFAEILVPGSSKMLIDFSKSFACNSLPESTAKGAQFQVVLRDIESKFTIDWFIIWSKVEEYLKDAASENIQPTLISINQVITALDYKPNSLDIFLSIGWYFDRTLLYTLHSLDPKTGAFDIASSKNLTVCFSDMETQIETQLGKKNIISFISVGRLEVNEMTKISNPVNQHLLKDQRSIESQLTKIFEHHCHAFPEYLICACLAGDDVPFINSLTDSLFSVLLSNDSKFLPNIIAKFIELKKPLLLSTTFEYYNSRQTTESLTKIIELSTETGYFDELFNYFKKRNVIFALNLIIKSSAFGQEFKTRIDEIVSESNLIPQAILEILEIRSNEDIDKAQTQAQHPDVIHANYKPLDLAVVHYLLGVLTKNTGLLDGERLKNLQLQLLTTYPRLINFGCGHDQAILANGRTSNLFSPEIEKEMKEYYSKMYNKELDIKEIVDMLIKFKSSDNPHDQDVFACMIHSLLDEYRFFSQYPLTALASTSLLFGALLQKDIIQGTTLTVALNFIWESCNQPQDSHLFKFAVQALYNFKARLHEYPNYCKHLLECKSLSAHAKMYQIVKDASNGIPCVDQSLNRSDPALSSSGQPMVNKSQDDGSGLKYQSITITVQTIGTVRQEKPNESLSDKLLFFVNNLTAGNLKAKLPEIQDLLIEKFYLWFADYLVADRAKSEPNNHKLYCELVKELHDPILHEYILSVSLKEVNQLIRNFKDTVLERSQLKNLGAWLGQITLASDKPLKRTHIGLKFLLVEAYDFKTLPYIIPFVCKILDQSQYSRIFKLPNPWVLGIVKVLVELYECADLKLNSKFEIEVLLNSFKLKISDVEPSTIIRNHNSNPTALASLFGIQPNANVLANDFAKLSLDYQGQQQPPTQFQPAQIPQQQLLQQFQQQQQQQQQQQLHFQLQQQQQQQQQQPQAQHIIQNRLSEDAGIPGPGIPQQQQQQIQQPGGLDTSFSNLVGSTIFTTNPNLRRAFQASLSRAVRECAIPILTKVSESVITTTEALIKKDFAYEADINKLRKSYQTLAVKLAHSMISCTGRKVLIECIEATMIQLLAHQINPNDIPLGELSTAIQQNVDLCVDIVNKIATGNIVELIEERMKPSIINREQNNGELFVDKERANDYSVNLPPPLGLRREGLSAHQLAVYESFASTITRPDAASVPAVPPVPQQAPVNSTPSATQATAVPPPVNRLPPQQLLSQVPPAQSHIAQQHTPQAQLLGLHDEAAVVEQMYASIVQNCDKAIQSIHDLKVTSISELPQDHIIMQCITNVLAVSQSNALKYPELLLKVAQYAVNCLFTQAHENPISNEIYVVILDRLCEYSPSTAKDVTWWLVHSSDQRKLNMPVMFSLLKVQLVQPVKLDSSISRLIVDTNSAVVVKFAATLLYNIFSSKELKPIALRSEFATTLQVLSKFNGDDSVDGAKEAKAARDTLFQLLQSDNTTLEDNYIQLGYVFAEWYRLLSHGEILESLKTEFIKGLYANDILSDPELFSTFFKSAVETSINSFVAEHEIRSRTQHETIFAVDALASLVVDIIIRFDKKHVGEALNYLRNIAGVVLVAFTNDHESPSGNWNERAYFRLFSSLLSYWNNASSLDENATKHLDVEFFNFIGEIFNSLQPIVFPGFTFAWVSLISHRMFLPRLVELPERKGHALLIKILGSLLRFEDFYSNDESVNSDVINVIFKAINRIFVGLYHDYPDFLSENYVQLVSAMPATYIQLKNIILSATPREIELGNPFTPGLKVDRIEEMKSAPVISSQYNEEISKSGLKRSLDNYLRIPAPGLVKTIYNGLKSTKSKTNYNVKLINALVIYSINADTQDNKSGNINVKGPAVSLLYDFLNIGSTEFKYLTINALANQLRYPNSHTQWTVGVLLHFFNPKTNWVNPETRVLIQELITRVLIERNLVNKPHPWGLTILLTELVKNDSYNFFQLPFVKNAPSHIKLIFDSLLKHINGS